jgi:hypothetical protein
MPRLVFALDAGAVLLVEAAQQLGEVQRIRRDMGKRGRLREQDLPAEEFPSQLAVLSRVLLVEAQRDVVRHQGLAAPAGVVGLDEPVLHLASTAVIQAEHLRQHHQVLRRRRQARIQGVGQGNEGRLLRRLARLQDAEPRVEVDQEIAADERRSLEHAQHQGIGPAGAQQRLLPSAHDGQVVEAARVAAEVAAQQPSACPVGPHRLVQPHALRDGGAELVGPAAQVEHHLHLEARESVDERRQHRAVEVVEALKADQVPRRVVLVDRTHRGRQALGAARLQVALDRSVVLEPALDDCRPRSARTARLRKTKAWMAVEPALSVPMWMQTRLGDCMRTDGNRARTPVRAWAPRQSNLQPSAA